MPLPPQIPIPGLIEPGNLPLFNRPVVQNPDGTHSTELSFSIGVDGAEVLLPRVVRGRMLSQDEAIAHYRRTGEHLGKFATPEAADYYAKLLHNSSNAARGPGMTLSKFHGR